MNSIDQEGVEIVAKLMAVAARTAPKTAGADWVQTALLVGEEKTKIAARMLEVAEKKANKLAQSDQARAEAVRMDWGSDARTVEICNALVLIGIQGRKVAKLNCGGCGFGSCTDFSKRKPLSIEEVDFPGAFCMFRVMDLSLASGSAVKVAMDNNVDNRLMQKVGIAALELGIISPCDLILGIPLSASGKNIFFDRPAKVEAWKLIDAKKE